jgi:ribonucleoside-diphosphate reductase alpha chain
MILPPITAHRSPGTSSASNIPKATIDVKKERRGVMDSATAVCEYSDAEKDACSIDAMMNGGTCEARQLGRISPSH